MTLEVILCQSLGKCISNLIFCVDREDFDKSLSYVFAKMMVANIYVLVTAMVGAQTTINNQLKSATATETATMTATMMRMETSGGGGS